MAQSVKNQLVALTTSSAQISPAVSGELKRTQVMCINTDTAATATVVKGDVAAVAGTGIIIPPGGSYVEATDGGFTCWQGAFQGIGSGSMNLSLVEAFSNDN